MKFRVAAAQIFVEDDIERNENRILEAIEQAEREAADILLTQRGHSAATAMTLTRSVWPSPYGK